jgi:hypothetical protein
VRLKERILQNCGTGKNVIVEPNVAFCKTYL